MKNMYHAALYCRLSKDDLNSGDSSSIISQKSILETYCKENGFDIVDYYVDDGYSGTNFERPDFERMLNDIDIGKIDLVITKDLSRLGRDYILTGYYLEIYFARKGIRYIAINDNYDSFIGDNDIAPFKNVLNDMYAKDISRKIKTAKLTQAKKGQYIGSMAPYGYIKDPNDINHFIVDREASEIVQRIYRLCLQGYGAKKIATLLESQKVINPANYKTGQGSTRFMYLQHAENYNPYCWNTGTILNILRNRVYLGEMIGHKTENINYKSKEKRYLPVEEQIIVKNMHEPIISEDDFCRVSEELQERYEKTKFMVENMFKGYISCSLCGCKMTFGHRANGDAYYRCVYSYRHAEKKKHINSIPYSVIYDAVKKKMKTINKLFGANQRNQTTESLTEEFVQKYIEKIIVVPKTRAKARPENRVTIVIKNI